MGELERVDPSGGVRLLMVLGKGLMLILAKSVGSWGRQVSTQARIASDRERGEDTES